MKKPLDPNSHAILDYALGAGCLVMPAIAGFNRISSLATYGVGIAQLGMSLFTQYPASVVKAIPFKLHGYIELTTGIGMVAASLIPNLLDKKAKTYFFSSGVSVIGIYMMTDYSTAAVANAQIEFDEMRESATREVNEMVDQFEEQIPAPMTDLIRKAS